MYFFFYYHCASPILAKSPCPRDKIKSTHLCYTRLKYCCAYNSHPHLANFCTLDRIKHSIPWISLVELFNIFHLETNVNCIYFRLNRQNRCSKHKTSQDPIRKKNHVLSYVEGTLFTGVITSYLNSSTAALQPSHQHRPLCSALRIFPLDSLCELQKMKEETSWGKSSFTFSFSAINVGVLCRCPQSIYISFT